MFNKLFIAFFAVFFLVSCNEENLEVVDQEVQQDEVADSGKDVVDEETDTDISDEVMDTQDDSSDNNNDQDNNDGDEDDFVVKTGTLVTTSDYVCEGDFTIQENETGITLILASNFRADQILPGYGMFLSNNPRSIQGALQIDGIGSGFRGHFSGSASFMIEDVGVDDYQYLVHWCVPFNIEVGVGEIQ